MKMKLFSSEPFADLYRNCIVSHKEIKSNRICREIKKKVLSNFDRIFIFLVFSSMIFLPNIGFSQVSLDPTLSQVVTFTNDQQKVEEITVIRDMKNPFRWFYVPSKPRLAEYKNEKNEQFPKFNLMTYQAGDSFETNEGGILQFSVNLGISEAAVSQIKKKIVEKSLASNTTQLSLTPLPIVEASARIYGMDGKQFANSYDVPGIAPTFANSAMPIQVNLNRMGAETYASMVTHKNSGVGVLYTFKFEGCLPPAGFKVTIDWDQTYSAVEKDKGIRVALESCFCGLSVDVSKQKIRKDLINNKAVSVESTTNEAVTDEKLNKYLDPIINRLCREMFDDIEPPAKIESPLVGNNSGNLLTDWFPSLKIEFVSRMKEVKKRSHQKEVIIMNQSVILEKTTCCGGFIGVGDYSEAVRNSCVTVMKPGSWAKAYLILPAVGVDANLNISTINILASIVASNGNTLEKIGIKSASWSKSAPSYWVSNGSSTAYLAFPLAGNFESCGDNTELINKNFKIKVNVVISQTLSSGNNFINVTYLCPMFNGALPLSTPVDLVDTIVLDGSLLSFGEKLSDQGLLDSVSVKLQPKLNSKPISITLNAARPVEYVLVEAGSKDKPNPIIPTIKFKVKGSAKEPPKDVSWSGNLDNLGKPKDLRTREQGLNVILLDEDWVKK
ncbi:MAG: hypothetical protein HQM08_21530 [Candidatus Riflebacteria bacterium]|nr:hypothetical protein [Candidatus Riflebacteria bacterium]